jgi:hypothetical protein
MAIKKLKIPLQGSIMKHGPIHKLKTVIRAVNPDNQTTDTTPKSRRHIF